MIIIKTTNLGLKKNLYLKKKIKIVIMYLSEEFSLK